MALEHFKTQILLLHSEQSTLDNLSNGFSDRYTVHCATSGSEALTTLGETQIDVIVTAQDLPGMSGLDALREAKKRSPETIGILLAGNADSGLEALVGDKEVFQVVRGSVTAESLRGLIDSATRQSRLMALAESANDTTANVDEPATEHIVMETSENGAAIISDGTGQVPVLNPQKVSAAAHVGANAVDVLVLTQDEEFLATIRESSRGMHNVIYANTLQQADEAVRAGKTGVAVVDAAMVGANVEKLTMHLRAAAPRLVAIVAGRRDDGEMLMDLINRGKVYRFLLKPVSPGRARLAVEASVKHHLEAPDSAFKAMGAAVATPAANQQPAPPKPAREAPEPAPAPASSPKAAAKAAAAAIGKAAPEQKRIEAMPVIEEIELSSELPTITVDPRPVPGNTDAGEDSLLDDNLSDAFGGDDSSLAETMSGFIKSVGRNLAPGREDSDADLTALDSGGGSLLSNPKILGGAALALLAAIGAGYFLFSGSQDAAPPAAEAEAVATEAVVPDADPVAAAPPAEPAAASADALLDEARRAVAAGQIVNPPGSNAVELYLAAANSAPGDAVIEAELADVVNQALAIAESALLDRSASDAQAALQRVALADADNPRLPFLQAQLAQIQLRNYLEDARLAMREARFEDARGAIAAAEALGLDAGADISAARAELADALSAERVDDVIDNGNARLAEGKLIAPSNDNARYYFELALSNDPGNVAARQGLTVVASKLVLQARERIDAGEFEAAEALLVDARRLDPASQELASAAAALNTAREQLADRRRLAAERIAAEQAAAEQAERDRVAAAKAAEEQAAADKLAAEQAAAKLAAEKAAAEQLAAEQAAAEQLAAEQAAAEQLAAEQAAAAKAGAAGPQAQSAVASPIINIAPVAVSALKRIKYVAPKYPRSAQRRNISGWVDVVFTVDIDGSVTDIAVRESDPGVTFVKSALDAVEDWKFEPIIENGVAVQKRAAVRMMFALE